MFRLSPEMVKAARTLLNWTQRDLAERSGLYIGSLSRFESGAGLRDQNMERLIKAFEEGGLTFIVNQDRAIGLKFKSPRTAP